MKSKNQTEGQPQVGSDSWLSFEPGKCVWIINPYGKAVTAYINAAIFLHPQSAGLPIVAWPREFSWPAGWTYQLDGFGWINESNVFGSLEAAVESTKPNANVDASADEKPQPK